MDVVDPGWDPPIGRLFLRETERSADLGFVTHQRIAPGAVIQYRTIAQRQDGETRPLFCSTTDGAEGRECSAWSGAKIRRYEPTDDDLRAFLATWSRRPPSKADWLLDLPAALAADEVARLHRLVKEGA